MDHRGFTLIELLVVVTIIGILAGLAVPGINKALNTAKQTADVANVRQLGLILFTLANEENGSFPSGGLEDSGTRTDASSSSQFFMSLLRSKELTEPKLIWGNSAKPKTDVGTTANASLQLTRDNLAFNYVKGLSTSSESQIPLLVSRGAYSTAAEFSQGKTLNANNVWGTQGVVAYTIGNSAIWVKATAKVVKPFYNTDDVDLPSDALLLQD
ncbi:MAG: prepilin-type N-terminal cleavage/methylation domain-containing protein [Verrucomicrobiales bacterium]|nr:prepilin-type N-terminal cleavage/methylation domain-containing protein [Verrucomicrobiales bacterium]